MQGGAATELRFASTAWAASTTICEHESAAPRSNCAKATVCRAEFWIGTSVKMPRSSASPACHDLSAWAPIALFFFPIAPVSACIANPTTVNRRQ